MKRTRRHQAPPLPLLHHHHHHPAGGQHAMRRSRDAQHEGLTPVTADSSSPVALAAAVRLSSETVSLCPPLRCVSSWPPPGSPGWRTTAASRPLDSSSSSPPPSPLLLLLLLPQFLLHFLLCPCLALSPCRDRCSLAPTSSATSCCLGTERTDRK